MQRIIFFLLSFFIITNFLYSCGSCGSDPVDTEDNAMLSGEIDADFLENNEIKQRV